MRLNSKVFQLSVLLLVLLCLVQIQADEGHEDEDDLEATDTNEDEATTLAPSTPEDLEAKYLAIEEGFKNAVNGLLKKALPHVLEASNNAELSPACMGSFLKMIGKMRNLDKEVFRSTYICFINMI